MRLALRIGEEDGGRMIKYVLRDRAEVSATVLRRAKAQGGIFLNGEPVHVVERVRPGDELVLQCEEPETNVPREQGEVRVLYEDAWYLCLDKPSGQFTHPTRNVLTGTLLNYALGHLPEGSVCHAVSRLDRDTCGVILFAKSGHAKTRAAGRLTKEYMANVYGEPEAVSGTIALPIRREAPGALRRIPTADGAPAVTDWHMIERRGESSLLGFVLHTGRTHQIRVHCLAMGHPILGDGLYNTACSRALSARLGIQTQSLCASRLLFLHPFTGQMLTIESAFQKNMWKAS